MAGHPLDSGADVGSQVRQGVAQLGFRHQPSDRAVRGGLLTLPQHYLHPAVDAEQVVAVLIGMSMLSKELDPFLKRIRDVHVPAVTPEVGIVALGRMIVKDDEIADADDLPIRLMIEARP